MIAGGAAGGRRFEVHRNLDHAGLRLITCGGDFSEADRRYADSVVVYATLTGSHTSSVTP
ncbi:class F sortase [Streptomyces niveus]|uniref:hypothetical protein n=1 Tax=Streptomyces niveus TaxID=193462 RepID=UPI003681F25D